MRSIIISACAAVTSIIAVNIATAARRRQRDKVILSTSSKNDPNADESTPFNYLLVDGIPCASDDNDLSDLTSIYQVITENITGQMCNVCESDLGLNAELMAETVANDILERYHAGRNEDFNIIATGLFAQIAICALAIVDKARRNDHSGSTEVYPKLILIQPILGWEQYRTYEEHELDVACMKKAKISEILLGNLAFLNMNGIGSVVEKSALLKLMTNPMFKYVRTWASCDATVIYDSASKYCGNEEFRKMFNFGGISSIDIRDYGDATHLANMCLIGKALREVCKP